ncbi:hypothetical protein LINPERPRIM_LOCUS638 [Linum perenne]
MELQFQTQAGTFYCNSPIVSEAKALLEASLIAVAKTNPTRILSDCQELINAINGPKHRWPWECFGFIGSILDLVKDKNIGFFFVPRAQNVKADWIARSARNGLLYGDWASSL